MKRIPRKWSRPYLLLEVLIALSLVALCMVPLLRPHIAAMRGEVVISQTVELQRLAGLVIADVRQRLYQHEYPYGWKNARPYEFTGPTFMANPLPGQHIPYTYTATVTIAKDEDGERLTSDPNHVERRVLDVAIDIVPVGHKAQTMHLNSLVLAERLKDKAAKEGIAQ
jgi:hypothetical protein